MNEFVDSGSIREFVRDSGSTHDSRRIRERFANSGGIREGFANDSRTIREGFAKKRHYWLIPIISNLDLAVPKGSNFAVR